MTILHLLDALDAVRDVQLSADDWKIIYEEQKKNEDDRKKGKSK